MKTVSKPKIPLFAFLLFMCLSFEAVVAQQDDIAGNAVDNSTNGDQGDMSQQAQQPQDNGQQVQQPLQDDAGSTNEPQEENGNEEEEKEYMDQTSVPDEDSESAYYGSINDELNCEAFLDFFEAPDCMSCLEEGCVFTSHGACVSDCTLQDSDGGSCWDKSTFHNTNSNRKSNSNGTTIADICTDAENELNENREQMMNGNNDDREPPAATVPDGGDDEDEDNDNADDTLTTATENDQEEEFFGASSGYSYYTMLKYPVAIGSVVLSFLIF